MVESCELRGQSKNSGEFLTLTPEVSPDIRGSWGQRGCWGQSKITPIFAVSRDNEEFTLTPTIFSRDNEDFTLTPTIFSWDNEDFTLTPSISCYRGKTQWQ